MRMPPRAAERFVADVARTDPDRLREALVALADLEVDSRGGAVLTIGRAPPWENCLPVKPEHRAELRWRPMARTSARRHSQF